MSKKLLITGIILAILAVVLINMRINQVEASQKKYAFLQLDSGVNLAAGDTIALDKLRIAKRYLVPRQRKEHGLKKAQLEIKEGIIREKRF